MNNELVLINEQRISKQAHEASFEDVSFQQSKQHFVTKKSADKWASPRPMNLSLSLATSFPENLTAAAASLALYALLFDKQCAPKVSYVIRSEKQPSAGVSEGYSYLFADVKPKAASSKTSSSIKAG